MRGSPSIPSIRYPGLLVFVVVPPAFLAVFAVLQGRVPAVNMYRDLAEVAMSGPCCSRLDGSVALLNELLWAASAAIVGFSLVLAWPRCGASMRRLLVTALALSGLLAFDDAYRLHEAEGVFLGLKAEKLLFPLYALALASYLRERRAFPWGVTWVLGLAAAGLGASVLVDQLFDQLPAKGLIEDTPKLAGTCAWLIWHGLLGAKAIRGASSPKSQTWGPATGRSR